MQHYPVSLRIVSVLLFAVGATQLSIYPALAVGGELVPAAELRQIKRFVSVEVQTQGTAAKMGLSGNELTDLIRVTFLKKVPGVSLEGSSGPPPAVTEPLNQLGFLNCEVWTVGEQQIVAYHIDCNAGSYLASKTPGSLWNRAILGYGPKDEVSEAVRKGLHTMVELFATTFSNARADGGGR